MSLIKQFDGYENAVKFHDLKKSEISGDIPKSTQLYSYEFGLFEWGDLLYSLLQYRREHNFYDVGDVVTYRAYFKGVFREGFGCITAIDGDLEAVNIDNNNIGVAISEICHATDAEIQAGRRL